jgi:hypothetical protein
MSNAKSAAALSLGSLCVLAACGTSMEPTGPEQNGAVTPPSFQTPGGQAGSGPITVGPMAGGSSDPIGGTAGMIAVPPTPGTATIPCDVATVVANRCHACHGAALVGGAPMRLMTHADFHADHVVRTTQSLIGQTMKAHALAKLRVESESTPMPPGARLPDPDFAVLSGWLAAGAPSGTAADANCSGAVGPAMPPDPTVVPDDPNETCYELPLHGGQTEGDTSPFTILAGERYHCFYYRVPWTEPVVATRFGNSFQNQALLHHWLLYTTNSTASGTSAECTGSHIGDNSQLLAGWAVGGHDLVMPPDTGLELPAPGRSVLVEWHLYNTTGSPASDSSAMRVCTVPRAMRPRVGSMTSLGTENFGFGGIPAGRMSDYGSTCVPSRAGMNATDPIRIFAFLPHMHKLGRNMRSVINRANGMREEVFNRPFDFMQQIHYDVNVELHPGDTITSTCTFVNDTGRAVTYGSSSDNEMCYQFVLSSPAGALKNGAFGLNGATTNCW